MKQLTFKIGIFTAVCALFFSVAFNARAAVTVQTQGTIKSGDTTIVSVLLDTEGKTINAIDGVIAVSDDVGGDFQIKEISVAGSAFSIWPRKPSLTIEGHSIMFTGGAVAGVNDTNALLFKIVIQVNKPGAIHIASSGVIGYLNDGLGTSVSFKKTNDTVTVLLGDGVATDAWKNIVAGDNIPPEKFTVLLGQDQSMFDGMKFLSFETTDTDSGIDYFDVKEGAYEYVRTGTTYVLQNQDKVKNIIVRAHDKAGNIQIATFGMNKKAINWQGIIIVVLIASVVFYCKRIIRLFKRYVLRKK